MSRWEKLLEVYTVEEILESMELEVSEALELLEAMGYTTDLQEPL